MSKDTIVKKSRGFRFSFVDACAIALCTLGVVVLEPIIGTEAYLGPFVLGHFFLFCNVFRVRRRYELIWAALFLVHFSAWRLAGIDAWWPICLLQTPVTLGAIYAEIRSAEYHGIFSQESAPSLSESSASTS